VAAEAETAAATAAAATEKRPRKSKSDTDTPPGELKKTRKTGTGKAEGEEDVPGLSTDSETEVVESSGASKGRAMECVEDAPATMAEITKLMTTMFRQSEQNFEKMIRKSERKQDEKFERIKGDILEDVHGLDRKMTNVNNRLREVELQAENAKDNAEVSIKKMKEQMEGKWEEMAMRMPVERMWPTKIKGKEGAEEEGDEWLVVKGKGKDEAKQEEMARTVVFSGYGEGIEAEEVVKHMREEFLKEYKEDGLEGVFAFGKKIRAGGWSEVCDHGVNVETHGQAQGQQLQALQGEDDLCQARKGGGGGHRQVKNGAKGGQGDI
jgi:hypothetical protein